MTTKGRTRPLGCIRPKGASAEGASAEGASAEERKAYWTAKQAADRAVKSKSRKARNKLRAAARKSAKQSFAGNRDKDRRPTISEAAAQTK